MLFTTPSSIKVAKTFFIIIKIIGPINIPSTPINLKPVYMAINVKIGCVPMCLLTNLGSKNCLTVDIIISKTIILRTVNCNIKLPKISKITFYVNKS